jgi:hypothetical protein
MADASRWERRIPAQVLDDRPTLTPLDAVPDAVDGAQEVDATLAQSRIGNEREQVVVALSPRALGQGGSQSVPDDIALRLEIHGHA